MNQINYAAMSDQELRQYFLQHREDKIALEIYLERLNEHPRQIIATVDAPDFDSKLQVAIEQKILQAKDNKGESAV